MKNGVLISFVSLVCFLAGCGPRTGDEEVLPEQPDRWVQSIYMSQDTTVSYVGQTKDLIVTTATEVKDLENIKQIKLGDDVHGIQIGAIKCFFHRKDAWYGNERFMWRGRWSCMAGRSEHEIEFAVKEDGTKLFDYISASPVSLAE